MPPARNLVAAGLLRKAIRAQLKDKHDHSTPREMTSCPECTARLWVNLSWAAPKGWLGGI